MDKYYTNSDVVKRCGEILKKTRIIKEGELIIEPSAGSGAFLPIIRKLSKNYKMYDIKPERSGIKKQDFLKLELKGNKKIHIIGNPPFGNRMTLCKKFIKKSSELGASTIAFILPKTFKKKSQWNVFPKQYHLIYQEDIPRNSFTYKGETKNINSVFQVWIRLDKERKRFKSPEPVGFSFVKENQDPDIAIKRRSRNGIEIVPPEDITQTALYFFIRFEKEKDFRKIVCSYVDGKLTWKSSDTAMTAPYISKDDITERFTKILKH
jgi:hypothetical protein